MPSDWSQSFAAWRTEVEPLLQEARYCEAFRTYPWITFTEAPLSIPSKPLRNMAIAVISSGGVVIPGQPPFDEASPYGDSSFRWIASSGPLQSWHVHHSHYDTTAARQDYNSVFPLDVVRQLADEGAIGRVAPRHVSFMGYQPDPQPFLETSAPEIAAQLQADGVDAVLLVPV
ncbi:MAG: glycine/sarcosine/betaine reductase selenoprotein B family protein [Thermaerobacter sp.]|nr:glycine/sarcosine/betaine reductase selenoprotein B family protein [Thermaerobacter sp.]